MFFANLLPEGAVREAVCQRLGRHGALSILQTLPTQIVKRARRFRRALA